MGVNNHSIVISDIIFKYIPSGIIIMMIWLVMFLFYQFYFHCYANIHCSVQFICHLSSTTLIFYSGYFAPVLELHDVPGGVITAICGERRSSLTQLLASSWSLVNRTLKLECSMILTLNIPSSLFSLLAHGTVRNEREREAIRPYLALQHNIYNK